MKSQIESGIELLARLKKKRSLRGLEDALFLEGPQATDIIEISGAQSSGKTLLLSQMLARCILPNYLDVKGCDASAVLINTDHHFQISKLVELMGNMVNAAANTVSFAATDVAVDAQCFDKSAVVKNSLRNLHVVDCYDSEQLAVTLRTLDDIFVDNSKIALLAIDSVTAYYWQDCEDNVITIDAYAKNLLRLVGTHTARFNVATVYTKLYKNIDNKGKKLTDSITNYRIQLRETCSSKKNFICTVETTQIVRKIHYSILSDGIKWKMDEKQNPAEKESN